MVQKNLDTNKAYLGGNQVILASVKASRNYNSDYWLTYVQARELGYRLEGAKGQGVHLRTFAEDKLTGQKFPKSFVVFNCDLCVRDIEKEEVTSLL